jgi:leucyl aminopeptidase
MGGILGVARGTEEAPKLLFLEYEGPSYSRSKGKKGVRRPVVLVGKGVCFDSGGLDLKTADGMLTMKGDMLGAAAVLATISVASELRLPLRIIAVAPCSENMPGPRAYKPGDVLKAYGGQTVEVNNTDAEGRLLLMDALSYATAKLDPSVVIDIATLTGAAAIALGRNICAGLMGTDRQVVDAVRAAAERSGERVWELPLYDEFYELIKSDIADFKNSPGRDGGTISAGAFLSKFTHGRPWAHVDIANTSWMEKDHPYCTKGATGAGVRLLSQMLMDMAADGGAILTRAADEER